MTIDDDIEKIIGPELNGSDQQISQNQVWNKIRIFLFKLFSFFKSEIKDIKVEIKDIKNSIESLRRDFELQIQLITDRINRHSRDRTTEHENFSREINRIYDKIEQIFKRLSELSLQIKDEEINRTKESMKFWGKISFVSGTTAVIMSLLFAMLKSSFLG